MLRGRPEPLEEAVQPLPVYLRHWLLELEGRCILSHLAVPLCLRQGSLHSLAEEERRCLPL